MSEAANVAIEQTWLSLVWPTCDFTHDDRYVELFARLCRQQSLLPRSASAICRWDDALSVYRLSIDLQCVSVGPSIVLDVDGQVRGLIRSALVDLRQPPQALP